MSHKHKRQLLPVSQIKTRLSDFSHLRNQARLLFNFPRHTTYAWPMSLMKTSKQVNRDMVNYTCTPGLEGRCDFEIMLSPHTAPTLLELR